MNKRSGSLEDDDFPQIKAFRKAFVEVDNPTLFDLILAANYLNISSLLDITCQAVAEQIKGKTPEQIRERFNIEVRLFVLLTLIERSASCAIAK